jgi:hypothetical protein
VPQARGPAASGDGGGGELPLGMPSGGHNALELGQREPPQLAPQLTEPAKPQGGPIAVPAAPTAPTAATSTFAASSSWAAAAALGSGPGAAASSFARPSIMAFGDAGQRLGGSSSTSVHGYSSDDREAGESPRAGGGGAELTPRGARGGETGRGVGARRGGSRPSAHARGGGGVGGDSEDGVEGGGGGEGEDGEGEGFGGYSPLQEYGSVYESTHDDWDEQGGDEDDGAAPLGRSAIVMRHLAGALQRSRMRQSQVRLGSPLYVMFE